MIETFNSNSSVNPEEIKLMGDVTYNFSNAIKN